ncbi:receptor-like serine/threonine-protein kinase At4g25390 isoform X2 [Vigna radiata var. radiata]|uniref:Receptor-like serine/threonine-protein kinase At4g25390 isoform X2 n=1 Tax=Vigna radiata var. radiata TaxID=3916 RepID=A0A3Q0F9Y6_VIGRR|nr:receptor-like serine/threonine-protein kinase At4g25390 isoform X2 [Vigna radiata var. radiata]
MPSRQLSTSSDTPPHHHHHHFFIPLLAVTISAFFLLLLFLFLFLCLHRTLTRKRAAHPPPPPPSSSPPHRLSFSVLRRATNSFSSRLGHGGFGPVFAGTLAGVPVAVKLMDSASSHQGEREFHNELFFASKLLSPHVITATHFSSDPKRRRFLLVYELMQNGNLQDALLHRKCPELSNWNTRFSIILNIAKGIHFLHSCDPPVIHGDIKPSNVLLDRDFSPRIGDFGLARLSSEPPRFEIEVLECGSVNNDEEKRKVKEEEVEDCGSVASTHSVFMEEGSLGVEQSPSPETAAMMAMTSPETGLAVAGASPGFEKEDAKKMNGKGLKSNSVRDWWWKHENDVGSGESKKVKDYVMEWIGRDVNKERVKGGIECGDVEMGKEETKKKKKKRRVKEMEWWESMEEEKFDGVVKRKRKTVRDWWKDECFEENEKKDKKKKKKRKGGDVKNNNIENGDDWWVSDDALDKRKGKSRSRNNRGNMDWWMDGLSGELWRGRRNNSFDSASGEIPKSGGVSSTPSMRGTVCYVAPECGYGGDVTEKSDVYSFGVLLLVIISGRRPLQVSGSPLSEFQRANLLSWARHCARNGKLLELVDESLQLLDKEQTLLCIKVALLCLQKSPIRRPSMKEVVGMLSGVLEPPQLPVEYSPSTPSRYPFKSRRKGRLKSHAGNTSCKRKSEFEMVKFFEAEESLYKLFSCDCVNGCDSRTGAHLSKDTMFGKYDRVCKENSYIC